MADTPTTEPVVGGLRAPLLSSLAAEHTLMLDALMEREPWLAVLDAEWLYHLRAWSCLTLAAAAV